MINDDKNLFDDFDLFSDSADSLFASTKTQETKNNKTDEKLNTNQEKQEPKEITEQAQEIVSQTPKSEDTLPEVQQDKTSKKPEKKSKEKKSSNGEKKKLSKLAIILISVAVCIVVALTTFLVIYIKHINTKLETPAFAIYQRSNSTVIDITKVQNATSYEITITQDGKEDNTFVIMSNSVELKSLLNQPGIFKIKIRALGKTAKATSDYSETKTLTNYIKLKAPDIFVSDGLITWNPINNAKSYKLFYKANLDSDKVDFIEISQSESLISYELSNIEKFGPALYPICVKAIAEENSFYTDSDFSKTINHEYFAEYQSPILPEYSRETKTLSFMLYQDEFIAEKYKVVFTLQDEYKLVEHYVLIEELEKVLDIYNSRQVIRVKASFKEIVNGEILNATITAVSDNEYAIPSQSVDIIID